MSLAIKMNMKPSLSVAVLDQPDNVRLDFGDEVAVVPDEAAADALVVFLPDREASNDGERSSPRQQALIG